MKGIDIYQGESINGKSSALKPIPEKAYKESDFVIVKSTQGVSYGHTEFFHNMIKRVMNDGKLAGAYHYAAGNDPIKEADYFLKIVSPYIGKILLCLDWESYQNKAWGNKTWCKKFIDRVKEKTGIDCVLYTGMDGCKQNVAYAGQWPLWYAAYPKPQATGWNVPKFKYNLGKWKSYAIWQYTSTNEKVDRNITDWTSNDWMRYAANKSLSSVLLSHLSTYDKYIKNHYKYFKYEYDTSMTTFAKAKEKVNNKKKVGITCFGPLRWALAAMDIKNSGGKYLIFAQSGSFAKCYNGDVKKYLERITKDGPIGKTIKQAVDSGQLKAGDIICFKNLTHTFVYSGKGYKFYDGGNICGNYSHGILIDYANTGYKDKIISEVLRWKTTNATKQNSVPKTDSPVANTKGYTGIIPEFSNERSYYQYGDGYKTLTNYKTQIKRVQSALNWALNGVNIVVDGEYGKATENAVMLYQKTYGLNQDGKWGKQCNAKLKTIKK